MLLIHSKNHRNAKISLSMFKGEGSQSASWREPF